MNMTTVRRVFVFGLAILLGLAFTATCAESQGVDDPVLYMVDSAVRAKVAHAWDDTTAEQVERAMCLTYTRHVSGGRTIYTVVGAHPAPTTRATPVSVHFQCPRSLGAGTELVYVTHLHTHLPITCDGIVDGCRVGGGDAFTCYPSDQDRRTVKAERREFGVVQCDRNAWVFFGHEGASRWRLPFKWVAAATGAALVANAACVGVCDRDPGGYVDSFRTGDKAVHALSAAALTYGCSALTGRSRTCAALTLLAGIGFEYTQGKAQWRDMVADGAGAGVALLTLEFGR